MFLEDSSYILLFYFIIFIGCWEQWSSEAVKHFGVRFFGCSGGGTSLPHTSLGQMLLGGQPAASARPARCALLLNDLWLQSRTNAGQSFSTLQRHLPSD